MENNDILKELEINSQENIETNSLENKYIYEIVENEEKFEEYDIIKNKVKQKKSNKFISALIFLVRYSITCLIIFVVLMVGTNYQAYFNIVKSKIYKKEMQEKAKSIINSVEAASLKTKVIEKIETEKNETKIDKAEKKKREGVNIKKYKKELDSKDINLNIEITPYENRIIIPKIGKNVPLVDIKNRQINSANELEDIFMDELKNGVIRYPGSAIPGENGTTFLFGHSSNFPWVKGNYNDVFATLDNVVYGDEIIVYYGQKKYKYVIREKKVVSPGDVSVLKRNKNKKELSIMTCWPVGTTKNRLLVTGEIVKD